MNDSVNIRVCKSCGQSSTGNYCSNCGQALHVKRITFRSLLHDIFHLFTHLDKGFGYTVKQLIVAPGYMQRNYIDGERTKHQKPFSMFFICATIAALTRYWVLKALNTYYQSGAISEADFFHEYMVLLNIALLPIYILITYLFFYKSKFNFAETGVLLLYAISFIFIASTFVILLKFIWHDLDTAYIEFLILLLYNAITFINFYREQKRWKVLIKSVMVITIIFFLVQITEDYIFKILY